VRRSQLSENVFDKPLQAGIEMALEFVGMRWDDPFRLLVGARWGGHSLRPVAAIIAQPNAIPRARLVPGTTSAVGTSVAEGAGSPASGCHFQGGRNEAEIFFRDGCPANSRPLRG
jgi:hypothetical protein